MNAIPYQPIVDPLANTTRNPANPTAVDVVLSMAQVRATVTYSASQIYRMIAAGTFPAPVRLGPGRVAWRRSAVVGWLDERERQSSR